jgi:hypothetical protein
MRYFFHVEDGACIRDPKGEDFADDAAAMREATKVAHELSKLRLHPYEWQVVVKNADGVRVGSVPLVPLVVRAKAFLFRPGQFIDWWPRQKASRGLRLIVREIISTLHEVRAAGLAILLVEQNIRTAFAVAERHYIFSTAMP